MVFNALHFEKMISLHSINLFFLEELYFIDNYIIIGSEGLWNLSVFLSNAAGKWESFLLAQVATCDGASVSSRLHILYVHTLIRIDLGALLVNLMQVMVVHILLVIWVGSLYSERLGKFTFRSITFMVFFINTMKLIPSWFNLLP